MNNIKGTFRGDLNIGREWENLVVIVLQSLGFEYLDSPYTDDYDVEMKYNEDIATFEIKTDFKRTGNIVIEFECNGEPSGISKSLAKFWCFVFPYDWQLWIIRAENLKELCIAGDVVIGGYKARSKLYKFDKMQVMMNFNVIEYKKLIYEHIKKHPGAINQLPNYIVKEYNAV